MVLAITERNGSFSPKKFYKLSVGPSHNGVNNNNNYNPGAGDGQLRIGLLKEENPQPEPSCVEKVVSPWLWYTQLLTLVQLSFLPLGYPESVSKDYLAYQVWDTIQDVMNGLCLALANSCVLKASVGLGNDDDESGVNGIEVAAGVAFIMLLKQTCTKIGPVCLGWAKCQTFDSKSKKWRFLADFFNDFIMFIEICTPVLPSRAVVPACCIAEIVRGVVGVVGASSRASLIVHHARNNNAADVSTKEKCQLHCANLICLLFASTILLTIIQSQAAIFTIYFILTAIHLFANIKGQRVLLMTSLNEARLLICLQQYLRNGTIPSVRETNERESIFFGFGITDSQVCGSKIIIGSSLRDALVLANSNGALSADYFNKFQQKSFLIIPCQPRKEVHIVLVENMYENSAQLLEPYLRAVFMALESQGSSASNPDADAGVHFHPMNSKITERVQQFTAALKGGGFEVEKISFGVGCWRCSISKTDGRN